MDKTANYYNENAQNFFSETAHLDLADLYKPFLSQISNGGHILDAGCGSGRDTKYFKSMLYFVTAFDSSIELCKLASDLTDQEILHFKFDEIKFDNTFDGIWACASLLHLPKKDLPAIFQKFSNILSKDGVIYCSFKYGEFEGERNGRYFTDLTLETFQHILNGLKLIIKEHWITTDIRPERQKEKWLNVILNRQ